MRSSFRKGRLRLVAVAVDEEELQVEAAAGPAHLKLLRPARQLPRFRRMQPPREVPALEAVAVQRRRRSRPPTYRSIAAW